MNESQDGIWIIDADSKTILANARMAEILGASPDEMLGQPSFSYVFAEDVAAAQRCSKPKARGIQSHFILGCAERTAQRYGWMCRAARYTTPPANSMASLAHLRFRAPQIAINPRGPPGVAPGQVNKGRYIVMGVPDSSSRGALLLGRLSSHVEMVLIPTSSAILLTSPSSE
jgi:hypothetical protein